MYNYTLHRLVVFFCRLQLAALHYNENADRRQAVTKEGEQCFNIIFPKYKKGGYVVRKVMEKATFGMCYVYTWYLNCRLYSLIFFP